MVVSLSHPFSFLSSFFFLWRAAVGGQDHVVVHHHRKCEGQWLFTFLDHANAQALLEAAVLAAVASSLVHRTVLAGQTHILGVLLHGAL